ncbi:MAG: hypothetical protein ACLVL7_00650 [Anaerotruncus massiliensis (ex Togo et al. 2019)]
MPAACSARCGAARPDGGQPTLAAGGSYAGGVAGTRRPALGTVRSVGDVSGGADVGGLFGGCDFAPGGLVNEANVLGGQRVGGLVGSNRLTITGSEDKGLVRGYPVSGGATIGQIGGIAGLNAAGGRIEDSKNSAALYNGAGVSEAPGRWEALPANALTGRPWRIAGENAGRSPGCTAGSVFGENRSAASANYRHGFRLRFHEFSAANGIVQAWRTGGVVAEHRFRPDQRHPNGPDRRAPTLLAPGTVDVRLPGARVGQNAGGCWAEEARPIPGWKTRRLSAARACRRRRRLHPRRPDRGVNRGSCRGRRGGGRRRGAFDQSLEGCRNEGRAPASAELFRRRGRRHGEQLTRERRQRGARREPGEGRGRELSGRRRGLCARGHAVGLLQRRHGRQRIYRRLLCGRRRGPHGRRQD